MAGVPVRNQTLWAKVYSVFELAMPWKYTGVYSHPEFRSLVPEVHNTRPHAPTNPPFRPIVPVLENDKILDPKNFRETTKRSVILADREITPEQVASMSKWQEKTPLGGRRFRWAVSRDYIYNYEDNGYR